MKQQANLTTDEVKMMHEADFYANMDDPKYADMLKEIFDFMDTLEAQDNEAETASVAAGFDNWNAVSTSSVVLGLEERNRLAIQTIRKYALAHTGFDVAIGVAGTFIPGAAVAGIITSMVAQYPIIYRPMMQDLGRIYTTKPDMLTQILVAGGTLVEDIADIGVEDLQEFMVEAVREQGIAALMCAALPFLGGTFGAGINATVTSTMTWRIGTMIALYYQNGGKWLTGTKQTYEKAKEAVGNYSLKTDNRVDFDTLSDKTSEIREKHINAVGAMISTLRAAGLDKTTIIVTLKKQKVPEKYISEAISRCKFD